MIERIDQQIKDLKLKLENLEKEKFLTDQFLDRITDAFVALDENWCYTYVNKHAGILLNREPQDLIGKHIWTEFSEGIDQPFYNAYQKAFENQKYVYFEEYYSPYDKWFSNHIYPSPNGLSIYFKNITEEKKAEKQLKKSELFNRSILNSIDSQIIVIENCGTIVAVNELWKNFITDNGETTLIHCNDECSEKCNYIIETQKRVDLGNKKAAEALEVIREVTEGKKAIAVYEYPCNNQHVNRWFMMRVTRFEKNLPMVVIVHTEITNLKKVEEQLLLKNTELIKSNNELDRFVYSTSHDLRSPLKSILGLSELIKDEMAPDDIEQKGRMDMIKESVIKLDDFIEYILVYSKNSRLEVTHDEIIFDKLIQEIRNSLQFLEGSDSIKLILDIDESLKIISDKNRLTVIMNNIITNAVKYQRQDINDSFVKVSVKKTKNKLTIIVEDNGIGIEKEKQSQVFDMFFRATHESTGSGLGLYIIKEMIEKLNGSIIVESELLKGSKFTVTIPNLG
ncbi:PAS domain-containing sensor histidine kinase [uncultured Flavobacterium sp.]|uniref:PAS domain-containing sensor histidine kinase n=1 Tax=uncultured Flavobacterium sp. TaxID=165435 RepID=UPI0030EE5E64|tara:strand:- start:179609 stop:181135 length:1527 start_codon:yes stop_codon:yes gene_type:complete